MRKYTLWLVKVRVNHSAGIPCPRQRCVEQSMEHCQESERWREGGRVRERDRRRKKEREG